MKKNYVERFIGFTLAINPIFVFLGIIYLSAKRTKGIFCKLKSDKINVYLWLLLSISGLISIIFSINKTVAISSYLIPFAFIWLYILGRWTIQNPETFIRDMLRGVGFLSSITIIAKILELNIKIGSVILLSGFDRFGRGQILYIGDNGLGLLVQVGVVGAFCSAILNKTKKKYLIENIIIFILSIMALLITKSRGAMMGALGAIFYFVFSYNMYMIFGAISLTGVLAYFSKGRFMSIFDLSNHKTRLRIWRASLQIVKDNFWFGVGPGNFGQIIDKYKPIDANNHWTVAHSNYLNIFIGWGVVGGLLFWGWHLSVFIKTLIKGISPLQKVIIAILISFYLHIAVNDLFAAYSGFLLGLLEHPKFRENS